MACDKGLIPWNGKCLTPAEFIKESTGGNKGGSRLHQQPLNRLTPRRPIKKAALIG